MFIVKVEVFLSCGFFFTLLTDHGTFFYWMAVSSATQWTKMAFYFNALHFFILFR